MYNSTHLGIALRQSRRAAKLSLRDLGAMSGLSATFLSELERGSRNCSPGALNRIAAALSVPFAGLHRLQERDRADILKAELAMLDLAT